MMPVLICNLVLNFREDSMVIDVGEPADWVKINVRQTVSFILIILFNYAMHKYHRKCLVSLKH